MKTYKLSALACICFLIASLGCGSDDGPTPHTFADTERAFQEINVSPGIQDITLKITETLDYDFRVIFPNVDLMQPTPLVFALHFDANGDVNVHKDTDCYVEPGLKDLNAIIISPNGGLTVWGTLENQDKIRILLELASRYWSIDLDRVAVAGYSSGGNGAWFFSETQPAIFSAGIAMASGYNVFRPDNTVRTIGSPMYVIHGEEDDFFPIDTVQYWVEQTVAAGSDVTFVKAPGLGHYQPCDYTSYLETAAIWLRYEIWQ